MADDLIAATMNVQSRLKIMKQFRDLADHLDKVARHRPRLQIIQYLAKESQKIKDMEEENAELRQSLEEHQTTLEIIMSKYREQMDKLNSTVEMEAAYHKGEGDFPKKLQAKDEKIKEMAAVMLVAADNWEEEPEEEQRRRALIETLRDRNRMLRGILLNAAPPEIKTELEAARGFAPRTGEEEEADGEDSSDSVTPSQSPKISGRVELRPNHVKCSSETLNSSLSDLTV